MNKAGAKGKKLGLAHYMESTIAPILAHELAHYYNRHTFRSIKKRWSLNPEKVAGLSLDLVQHSQKQEFEADATVCIATTRYGNPDCTVWLSNECDARSRNMGFWNTRNTHTLKTVDQLMEMYYLFVVVYL